MSQSAAIRQVVIPLAGRATRLMPMTSVLPKALFPLVCPDSAVKPVVQVILEQVRQAGIERVALVVSPGQKDLIQAYLREASHGSEESLPEDITFLQQDSPRGFGDAVWQARSFLGDEPFAVLLGDHVHIADPGRPPCLAQVLEVYRRTGGVAMVGMHEVPSEELARIGVASGECLEEGIYRCMDFIEKPDLQTATQRLRTPGLRDGTFLGHCGIYAFTPVLFDCLDQVARQGGSGEVEMAAAQEMLLRMYPGEYYLYRIQGRAHDMGTPKGYLKTLVAMAGTDND